MVQGDHLSEKLTVLLFQFADTRCMIYYFDNN